MPIARSTLAVIALVAIAWFALGVRQARDTAQATSLLVRFTPLTAAQLNHAANLVNDAAFLNPDQQVNLMRGWLQLQPHHRAAAELIFAHEVLLHPQDINGWDWLFQAANGIDPATAQRAQAQMLALEPPD